MSEVRVTEYTDPGSVWAWGSEPKLRLLEWRFGHGLAWRRVLGGMIDDLEAQSAAEGQPVHPRTDAGRFVELWRSVHATTGMPFPTELRAASSTTKLACLAVKAAERQGSAQADRVLRRLREWMFLVGEPFDTMVSIVAAVSGVPDLDIDDFVASLSDPEVLVAYQQDWEETRRPNAHARQIQDDHDGHGRVRADGTRFRYAFPTVVIDGPSGSATVAGWKPIEDYVAAVAQVAPSLADDAKPDPTTDQVIARWGTAADVELATLAGPRSADPTDVVVYEWGGGAFFLTVAEARARGLRAMT
ncbi:MAG: DsbA family protein [Actinomycetota bacterium]